jgi:hypothetical protein
LLITVLGGRSFGRWVSGLDWPLNIRTPQVASVCRSVAQGGCWWGHDQSRAVYRLGLNIRTPQVVSRCSSLAVALKQLFTRATHATVPGALDTGSLPMLCHGQGLSVRANTPGRISGETDRLRFGNSDRSPAITRYHGARGVPTLMVPTGWQSIDSTLARATLPRCCGIDPEESCRTRRSLGLSRMGARR